VAEMFMPVIARERAVLPVVLNCAASHMVQCRLPRLPEVPEFVFLHERRQHALCAPTSTKQTSKFVYKIINIH